MTPEHTTAIPTPGPDCAALASLLARVGQVDQGLLASDDAALLRAHVAGCPHCQIVLSGYAQIDRALRRLAESDAVPTMLLTEEIMQSIEDRDQPPTSALAAAAIPSRPARLHRLLSPAGAIAAVLLVSLIAGALFAGRDWLFSHTKAGSHYLGPNQPSRPVFTDSYSLSAVVPDGPNGTWVLGAYRDALCSQHQFARQQTPPPLRSSTGTASSAGMATPVPACTAHPLALKWDGQRWHRVTINVGPNFDPNWHVSVLPSGEAFALTGTTMLHLRDGIWRIDPVYAFPHEWNAVIVGEAATLYVQSLDMISPQEGWLAGTYAGQTTSPAAVAHYLNGKWTLDVLGPSFNVLHSISVTSPTEGWAVGTSRAVTITEQYLNGHWTLVYPSTTVGPNDVQGIFGSLNAVQTLSAGDAWAVGSLNPSFGPGLILHWANGTWNTVNTGIPLNILHSIDMVSPTEGWVVGDGAEILHLRNGTWTKEGATVHGFETDQVAMTSPSEGWAIGGPVSSDGPSPAVLHYHDGVWTMISVSTIVAHAVNG